MTESRRSTGGGCFRLVFPGGQEARAIRVRVDEELPGALLALGLDGQRPGIVLIGGAGGLGDEERVRPLLAEGLAPLARKLGARVVDGGTEAGVMRLMGEARVEAGSGFPLVGVAAAGTVALPGRPSPRPDAAALEPHHSHFVIVPGSEWGDESPWIARVAGALAGQAPSITVLINGGETAREDAWASIACGRPVVAVAGSGRAADALASALRGGSNQAWAGELAASDLVRAVDLMAGPAALVEVIEKLLFSKG